MSYKILAPEDVFGEENLRRGWNERRNIMGFHSTGIFIDDILNNDDKFGIGELKANGAYILVPFEIPDGEVIAYIQDQIDMEPPGDYNNTLLDINGKKVYGEGELFAAFVTLDNKTYAAWSNGYSKPTLMYDGEGRLFGKLPDWFFDYYSWMEDNPEEMQKEFKKINGRWHLREEDVLFDIKDGKK